MDPEHHHHSPQGQDDITVSPFGSQRRAICFITGPPLPLTPSLDRPCERRRDRLGFDRGT